MSLKNPPYLQVSNKKSGLDSNLRSFQTIESPHSFSIFLGIINVYETLQCPKNHSVYKLFQPKFFAITNSNVFLFSETNKNLHPHKFTPNKKNQSNIHKLSLQQNYHKFPILHILKFAHKFVYNILAKWLLFREHTKNTTVFNLLIIIKIVYNP